MTVDTRPDPPFGPDMHITEIHIFQIDLPVKNGPYTMAGTEIHALDSTIVKLVTNSGLVGWGETCPLGSTYQPHHATGARAALTELAPALIGQNPAAIAQLHRHMNATLHGHAYAKAAIDIAAHDLTARHYGIRVADLLGGAVTQTVPSYYATGIGTPDEMARLAQDKKSAGFKRLQIKVGGRTVAQDIEVTRKVFETVGTDMTLAVDANRTWSVSDTLHFSQATQDINLTIEQPTGTLAEIAALKNRLHHPLFIDESADSLPTALGQLEQGLCDGFGLKITRIGGLFPMTTLRDVCETRNIPHTVDDAWGGDIIAAACTHLGATVNPETFQGTWIAQPYIIGHYDSENGPRLKNGHIALPKGIGLGITPDASRLGPAIASFT